ncbi:MAG TPA: sensor histidine kinase, partial [Thermoanaerobaculia bacterium]|nr:sensor histidine kinase [Thermoanaerobaculia bacterium]
SRITLGEELDLVSRYLAIEKVRFGDRLSVRVETDEAATACLVPPLLLQPLVENAVRHGIASMVDGGSVELTATGRDGLLRIRIENPADPDRERTSGEGIGLRNARERLRAVSDGRATLAAAEADGRFRVEIELPS